ncbi:MAG: 3-deoxy-D-manno-octulosonic acid transferase [Paracoccaceae bacterium]|nr:3-deoxy-D-manno-octulosonic acid transferase [Paracoccaceae bacterium]MDE2912830.1 3-deoxy-D-manno-octulosonic acid transferase [Paracoccaceae bacterium]
MSGPGPWQQHVVARLNLVMDNTVRTGFLLRFYLALSRWRWVEALARRHLKRRLDGGREDPVRFQERLGIPSLPRPEGSLVWMHAVGVGELLAAPGLIRAMQTQVPGLQVLLTSTARTSAVVVADNLPPDTRHQFIPLDCKAFVVRFLDHWHPDLSVWVERDIWPTLVVETWRRGIPLAMVNGRMDATSFRAKQRARGLYSDLYSRFQSIGVQDPGSAGRFRSLGADEERTWISGSLKSGAVPLADRPDERVRLQTALADRRFWLAASTHATDEAMVADAQLRILRHDPTALLVIAPRVPGRAESLCRYFEDRSLSSELARDGVKPSRDTKVLVVNRIGQLGLWYRLADAAFVGGSVAGGGHNPYEPARLDCAILHGPCIGNFEADYAKFHTHDAARQVSDGSELAAAILDPGLVAMTRRVDPVLAEGKTIVTDTANRLLRLLRQGYVQHDPADGATPRAP